LTGAGTAHRTNGSRASTIGLAGSIGMSGDHGCEKYHGMVGDVTMVCIMETLDDRDMEAAWGALSEVGRWDTWRYPLSLGGYSRSQSR